MSSRLASLQPYTHRTVVYSVIIVLWKVVCVAG